MAKYCTHCGKALEQGADVCNECGTKVPNAENATVVVNVAPVEEPKQPQPNFAPTNEQTAPTGKYAVAGTASYFWLALLFSLPFVGFICSIIFSFAPQNLNIKHFSRSVMIWNIVAIAIVVLYFITMFIISIVLGIGISDLIYEIMYQ